MILLRLFLFSGLVLHKVVWEVLKRRDGSPPVGRRRTQSLFKRLVKVVKTLVLLFLVVQTLFMDIFPISENPAAIIIVGVVIYVVGLATAITGRVQLGNNWSNLEDYQVLPDHQLVENGIYRFIRHPIYTGDVFLILGLELALNSWLVVFALGLAIVVVRQTLTEEALLSETLPGYAEYQQRSKMFIPYLV